MLCCCGAGGPAVALGWATNSDFYIARNLLGFSFLALPILDAVIMGDPAIRDFRLGIDPLIFSTPVSRCQYLLGKFCGNFFVLVCCQAAFPLMLLALQAFRPSGMVVQPVKVLPYFQQFFFFVVITHLALAAFYFTVGTLTRNSKIVYGLAACSYPLFIAYGLFLLRPLTIHWRNFLDPFLLGAGPSNNGFGNSADFLNRYVVNYTADMVVNRAVMIFIAATCLTLLYLSFTTAERARKERQSSTLNLSESAEKVVYDSGSFQGEPLADAAGSGLYRHSAIVPPRSPPTQQNRIEDRVISSIRTFAAIAYNEVLLNSKRVAPYVIALLCAGNAVLWWGWGPATGRGLATNSDFFIAGVLPPYSFLFLPLYTALFMADPAIRDFRTGIDPLIFSKPVTRAEYLLGKFFGNFFVLGCCQSAFVLTLFVLQWVHKQGVTVVPDTKFLAYPKHFLVFVAISHMFLAAVYFTVATLTRNAKIVYGLGIAFYPIYIGYQTILLRSLPWRLKLALDPLVMAGSVGPASIHKSNPELLNQLVVVYDTDLIVNRVAMILLTAICLTILYKFFSTTERSGKTEELTVINLSTAAEGVYYPEGQQDTFVDGKFEEQGYESGEVTSRIAVPQVARVNEGIRATAHKLIAAIGVEFRLLRAERSLILLVPLALILSIFDVAFFRVVPEVSYSATYAGSTANAMLLFLIGTSIFYTGESMHRDRELRIEPVLWSAPISNSVLLMSKFAATLVLTLSLVALTGLTSIATQFLRGHRPVELRPYLLTYSLILFPGLVFLVAMALVLNVVLREKYVTYAVSVGIAAAMFYLYSIGYLHWLYNPLCYHLWKYAALLGVNRNVFLLQGSYWLVVAILLLTLAHVCFARKTYSTV